MAELTIDSLVRELKREEEQRVTSFRWDPEESEKRLRSYSLGESHLYPVKVVQFAVARGATRIEVSDGPTKLQIRFDGPRVGREDMQNLLSRLVHRPDVAAHNAWCDLALALLGALDAKPRQVTLESSGEDEGLSMHWFASGSELVESESFSKVYTNRFVVFKTVSQVVSEVTENILETLGLDPEDESLEIQHLRRVSTYCPCELLINGKKQAKPSFGSDLTQSQEQSESLHPSQHLLHSLWAPERDEPASLARPVSNAIVQTWSEDNLEQRFRAWMAVRADLSQESEIILVENGIYLGTERLELPCPGLLVVLSAELLPKNPTGFEILRNVDYKVQLKRLAEKARQVARDLDYYDSRFPESLQRRIAKVLRRTQKRDLS